MSQFEHTPPIDASLLNDAALSNEHENESPKAEKLTAEQELGINEMLDEVMRLGGWLSHSNENVISLLKKITSYGNKALPCIMRNLIDRDSYYFSNFLSNLAEEEDLLLALEAVDNPRISHNRDGSAISNTLGTIERLTVEIKKQNPEDARLNFISDYLIDLHKKTHPFWNQIPSGARKESQVLEAIALTGTDSAKQFLSSSDKEQFESALRYFSNPETYPDFYLRRAELIHERPQRINFYDSFDRSEFSDSNNFSDDFDNESFGDFSNHNNDFYDDDDDPRIPTILPTLSENTQKQIRDSIHEAGKSVSDENIETTSPIANLVAFNNMHGNGIEGRNHSFKNQISRMDAMESAFEKIDVLPSIGIEIECFKDKLTPEKVQILNYLDIENYEESDAENVLWEVNPHFSYSPFVQARYLQELIHFGAVPVEMDDNKKKISPDYIHSLHVNFGIPPEVNLCLEEGSAYRNEFELFSDILTYAFASPLRLLNRKTNFSYSLKPGEENKKDKKKSTAIRESILPKRLEYRANEFRSAATYRMLAESQQIAAMLFSYIKTANKGASGIETSLALLWVNFKHACETVLLEHDITEKGLVDSAQDLYDIVDTLSTTNLSPECRKLVTKFAKDASRLIKAPIAAASDLENEEEKIAIGK